MSQTRTGAADSRAPLRLTVFADRRITVEGPAVIFEIERAALALACREIDRWIVDAGGGMSEPVDATPDLPSKGTILVVDDESEIGPLAQDILVPDGYTVLSSTDPLEAIRMLDARTWVPDLLLADLVMPVRGGPSWPGDLWNFSPRRRSCSCQAMKSRGSRRQAGRFLTSPSLSPLSLGWSRKCSACGPSHPRSPARAYSLSDRLQGIRVNQAERAVLAVLALFAESSTALAAFVGILGMFRLHVLDARQCDAESEVRFWLKRLMKRESFVASFADVQVWLLEEQSGVAGPPHREFLTGALSANHRRDSGITPGVAATGVDVCRERRVIPRLGRHTIRCRAAGDRRRRRPARGAPASPLSACAGATGTPVVRAAMPAIMVVAAARWMSPTVFVYRYFLCLAPAIAVIMAWTIRGVRSSRIRLVLVTIVAGLSVLGMGVGVERMEDWLMALHAAADATNGKPVPVLVGATFIESARLRWPLDPEEAGYLVAPVAFYRVPGPAIPLPYDLGDEGAGYLRQSR